MRLNLRPYHLKSPDRPPEFWQPAQQTLATHLRRAQGDFRIISFGDLDAPSQRATC